MELGAGAAVTESVAWVMAMNRCRAVIAALQARPLCRYRRAHKIWLRYGGAYARLRFLASDHGRRLWPERRVMVQAADRLSPVTVLRGQARRQRASKSRA